MEKQGSPLILLSLVAIVAIISLVFLAPERKQGMILVPEDAEMAGQAVLSKRSIPLPTSRTVVYRALTPQEIALYPFTPGSTGYCSGQKAETLLGQELYVSLHYCEPAYSSFHNDKIDYTLFWQVKNPFTESSQPYLSMGIEVPVPRHTTSLMTGLSMADVTGMDAACGVHEKTVPCITSGYEIPPDPFLKEPFPDDLDCIDFRGGWPTWHFGPRDFYLGDGSTTRVLSLSKDATAGPSYHNYIEAQRMIDIKCPEPDPRNKQQKERLSKLIDTTAITNWEEWCVNDKMWHDDQIRVMCRNAIPGPCIAGCSLEERQNSYEPSSGPYASIVKPGHPYYSSGKIGWCIKSMSNCKCKLICSPALTTIPGEGR